MWVADYVSNKQKKSGFVCEGINFGHQSYKDDAAFCVTYKTKYGKIKTKWVMRKQLTAGARIVLTEKNIPIKPYDAALMSVVQQNLTQSIIYE